MAGFSEQFEHFVPPDPDTIRIGITSGLVVLDSNVLLSAYRFAPESRSELLEVLELVGERLWLPHQVGLEFHRNRLKVIAEYDAAYKDAIDTLGQRRKEILPPLHDKIRELSNRVALPSKERDELLGMLDSSFARLGAALEDLRDGHGVGQPAAPDSIFNKISEIFSGKMGSPFSGEDEKVELAEALSRVQNKQPPGYKDADKDEPHGDYFVWCQALREARKRQSSVLVLVTNDAKEDWYMRLKGQVVMARPELALECASRSGARLVMLPTRLFLSHARKYLEAEVSDETIRQAERVQVTDDGHQVEMARQRVTELMHDEAEHATQLHSMEDKRVKLQADLERAISQLDQVRERERDLSARKAAGAEISDADMNVVLRDISGIQLKVGMAEEGVAALQGQIKHDMRELDVKRAALNAAVADYEELRSRVRE